MPRRARTIVPLVPHHLTQRGVRKQRVFFQPEDYELYLELLSRWTRRKEVEVLCYCLMPNHIHILAVPKRQSGFAESVGPTHSEYARRINAHHGWTGHLWQARFYSCAVDEPGVLKVARYILLNPVRAGFVRSAIDWPYSSTRAHIFGSDDPCVTRRSFEDEVPDWDGFLTKTNRYEDERIRESTRRRVPFGSEAFVERLERRTGTSLRYRPRGRPRKSISSKVGDGPNG